VEVSMANIKDSVPGVLATMLKVKHAYHSHHMVEIGEEFYHILVEANVVGRIPSKPFFSSALGKLLEGTKDDCKLGPQYWRKNLESPVRFKEAVCSILQHPEISNPVFLEVGPHSALAGPIRQILMHESSMAPYIPSITRKQNSVEGFLSAIGKLYTLHVNIDFDALMPPRSALPDLPRYPWNHQKRYWYESRVSKDWRMREYLYHDLLGVKLPESTSLEPVWRNVFHLDNAPWIRDHKIKDDIVFPFAAYVAIAAEAVRQITKVQEGVSIRHVVVDTACVVSEGTTTEFVTNFRPHRLTNTTNSDWWDFTITSHNGHTWVKHCSGEVRSEVRTAFEAEGRVFEVPEELPRKVSAKEWY
jgi:acyl transferase domain-containing protein